MFKRVLSLGLAMSMVIGSLPLLANEIPQVQVQPSAWAQSDLTSGQSAGLLKQEWALDLHKPVSQMYIMEIGNQLSKKVSATGLDRKSESSLVIPQTKGEVLNYYYNILKDYTGLELKENMEAYMKGANILKGDEKGNLNLDKVCTLEEAIVLASRILDDVYKQTGEGTKAFVWEVSDEDNTVYLLGTYHLGSEEAYPVHDRITQMIKAVDNVSFEVDFGDQQGLMYLMQKQMYMDGTTLKEHVDADTYKKTVDALIPYGLTEEVINMYKPWALSNTMTVLLGQKDQGEEAMKAVANIPGIDVYVYSKALFEGKKIIEIEGYVYQADLLDSVDEKEQINSLQVALDELTGKKETGTSESTEVLEEWANQFMKGDITAFEKSYNKDALLAAGDKTMKMLFDERDDHMTEEVLKYLADTKEDYLVVVGAGHMIGEKGIIKQLQDKGYSVKVMEDK